MPNKDVAQLKNEQQTHQPLHGVTLEQIVKSLVVFYGWDELGKCLDVKCFTLNPSVQSALKFLRKTPWARKKVEHLYLASKKSDV